MKIEEVTLPGNEIILEPLRMEHAKELFEGVKTHKETMDHLAPGAEKSLRAFERWVERRLEEEASGTALPFMIHGKQTGSPIGSTSMFNMSARHHRIEIGHTWLRKEYRRTVANAEAKLLMLTHAFEEMDAVRVQFKVDTRNERASRSLERIGAEKEGLMRNERILTDGFIRDAYVYSIIQRDWPDVKMRLNDLVWKPHPGPDTKLARGPTVGE